MRRTIKREADLLITDEKEPVKRRLRERGAAERPVELDNFLNLLARAMLHPSASTMASFVAGKVFQKLERTGTLRDKQPHDTGIPSGLEAALQNAIAARDIYAEVAQSVRRLAGSLVWIRGRSGPFASLNFEKAHAHSVIVGPGGLEDRADIRVGLTYMEPYSRFPDHVQRFSRAFLLLSPCELSIAGASWISTGIGGVFAAEAGQSFAMRCTTTPLLAVWCHVEETGR
ncbi:dimethylsulfonioproprionate lyase family protein [Rhizobium sp. KDH_Rht_773_N]